MAGLGVRPFTDEMIDPRLAAALTRLGYDVESCHQAGRNNLRISDRRQLEYAVQHGRAVLTFNVAVAAGGRHSLALDNGGFVKAWGSGDNGQLGASTVGATGFQTTASLVIGYGGVKAIAASLDAQSLAIRDSAYNTPPGPAPGSRTRGTPTPGTPTGPDGRTGPSNTKPGNPSPREWGSLRLALWQLFRLAVAGSECGDLRERTGRSPPSTSL